MRSKFWFEDLKGMDYLGEPNICRRIFMPYKKNTLKVQIQDSTGSGWGKHSD
jgi:hypothetical protein